MEPIAKSYSHPRLKVGGQCPSLLLSLLSLFLSPVPLARESGLSLWSAAGELDKQVLSLKMTLPVSWWEPKRQGSHCITVCPAPQPPRGPPPPKEGTVRPGGGMRDTQTDRHTHTPHAHTIEVTNKRKLHYVTWESKAVTKEQNISSSSTQHFPKCRGTQRSTETDPWKNGRRVRILCGGWHTSLRKPSQPELCKWASLYPPWKRSSGQDALWEESPLTQISLNVG